MKPLPKPSALALCETIIYRLLKANATSKNRRTLKKKVPLKYGTFCII